jgi:vacuolar-type H+-ATPase subunit H
MSTDQPTKARNAYRKTVDEAKKAYDEALDQAKKAYRDPVPTVSPD